MLVVILVQTGQTYRYMVIMLRTHKDFGFILRTLKMLICGLERLSIPYPSGVLLHTTQVRLMLLIAPMIYPSIKW